jgi:hypothetical protein
LENIHERRPPVGRPRPSGSYLLPRHRELEPLFSATMWSTSLAAASMSICTYFTLPVNSLPRGP